MAAEDTHSTLDSNGIQHRHQRIGNINTNIDNTNQYTPAAAVASRPNQPPPALLPVEIIGIIFIHLAKHYDTDRDPTIFQAMRADRTFFHLGSRALEAQSKDAAGPEFSVKSRYDSTAFENVAGQMLWDERWAQRWNSRITCSTFDAPHREEVHYDGSGTSMLENEGMFVEVECGEWESIT